MFSKAKLFHWFCNKKSILSSLEFLDFFYKLLDFSNRIYNALFVCYQINFCIVIYIIKTSNIKKFYHVVSKFSFEYEHAIFSSFPSLFFHCLFLHFYSFLFEHLDLPYTHFWKLHHSYMFQLFHYSHLSYFHLQKIVPLVVFTRQCPKIMLKTASTTHPIILIEFLIKRKKRKKANKKNIYKQMGLMV